MAPTQAQQSQTPRPAAPKAPQPQPATQAPAQLPKGPDFVIPKTRGAEAGASPSISPDRYVVGPQDTLSITVVGEPELTNKYRVDNDGSITLPYIGRQPAAGFSIADLQLKITTLLKDGYLQNPQVLIDVDQYKSRSVYVTGNVRMPGKVPMNGPTITLDRSVGACWFAVGGCQQPDHGEASENRRGRDREQEGPRAGQSRLRHRPGRWRRHQRAGGAALLHFRDGSDDRLLRPRSGNDDRAGDRACRRSERPRARVDASR